MALSIDTLLNGKNATFVGLASSIIWDTLEGGNIGLKGAKSVAVGGCSFTRIAYNVCVCVCVCVCWEKYDDHPQKQSHKFACR